MVNGVEFDNPNFPPVKSFCASILLVCKKCIVHLGGNALVKCRMRPGEVRMELQC